MTMKVLKIMTANGAIYHMPLAGFPDAANVDLVEMTREEYEAVPATADAFQRANAMLAD
jgi:hypothetical protein